nr:Arm DNA-binding domain-containing protein [Bordetella hinzii]
MKALEKLTDIKVRTAKPGEKNYKLADGGGLYLLVKADGGKYWRYDYGSSTAHARWRWASIQKSR